MITIKEKILCVILVGFLALDRIRFSSAEDSGENKYYVFETYDEMYGKCFENKNFEKPSESACAETRDSLMLHNKSEKIEKAQLLWQSLIIQMRCVDWIIGNIKGQDTKILWALVHLQFLSFYYAHVFAAQYGKYKKEFEKENVTQEEKEFLNDIGLVAVNLNVFGLSIPDENIFKVLEGKRTDTEAERVAMENDLKKNIQNLCDVGKKRNENDLLNEPEPEDYLENINKQINGFFTTVFPEFVVPLLVPTTLTDENNFKKIIQNIRESKLVIPEANAISGTSKIIQLLTQYDDQKKTASTFDSSKNVE